MTIFLQRVWFNHHVMHPSILTTTRIFYLTTPEYTKYASGFFCKGIPFEKRNQSASHEYCKLYRNCSRFCLALLDDLCTFDTAQRLEQVIFIGPVNFRPGRIDLQLVREAPSFYVCTALGRVHSCQLTTSKHRCQLASLCPGQRRKYATSWRRVYVAEGTLTSARSFHQIRRTRESRIPR